MADEAFDGLSHWELNKIFKSFGDNLDAAKDNPYLLSRILPLKTVDGIARRLGVSTGAGNVHRGVALAEYALDYEALAGHCAGLVPTLCAKAKIKAEHLTLHDTIAIEGRYAMLQDLRDAERTVAEEIRTALQEQHRKGRSAEELGAILRAYPTLEFDESQLEAVNLMLTAPVGVVTGRPGTGKTTIVQVALDELDKEHVHYGLCAPTGKAAQRLSEASGGRPAQTIHRLLRWLPTGFVHNEFNPLPYDVVIVDESSMIDIRLAADLLRAVDSSRTRIIFVGDKNQLPSVGPGQVLADLLACGDVPTIELQKLHRAAQGSWIYRNAGNILAGGGVELDDIEDFEWLQIRTDEAEYVGEVVIDLIRRLMQEGCGWDDFQVLAPMKVRTAGTHELNPAIREAFLHSSSDVASIGAADESVSVAVGDRVIQTKNDYKLDVFNGETGEVTAVQRDRLMVRFGDEYRQYKSLGERRNLALAYALTIHKYQGSQVPIVIMVCHSVHGPMLNRRLFYTALTRAQKRVFLVGDERGVQQAIKGTRDLSRRTLLAERIRGEL